MIIEKFKKDKRNLYKIYFTDGTIISLYDDVIVKYNLLVNKNLSDKKFDEIIKYNDYLDGYYKAIKFINSKLRTEKEVINYLKKLGINSDNIEDLIELLYQNNFLNKERYIISYINDQYNLTVNGPGKIKKNLIDLGYGINEIEQYLYKFDWDSRIESIILKKIKLNHKLSNNSLKSKILSDIVNLGYEKSIILSIMESIDFYDEMDVLMKELIKIKNKYSKKYSDKELEYRVINYLFKKGFSVDDIKRCYYENEK